jgi:hypothetical protein
MAEFLEIFSPTERRAGVTFLNLSFRDCYES